MENIIYILIYSLNVNAKYADEIPMYTKKEIKKTICQKNVQKVGNSFYLRRFFHTLSPI